MNGFKRIAAILAVICFTLPALSQQVIDARSAAMGYSNGADTRGLSQVGLNPATLALDYHYNFEFNLISANGSVSNNSFSQGLYNDYFTSGDWLNSTDKNTILDAIPATGLGGKANASANIFSLYMPNFSLALCGIGSGAFTLPREVFEIALNGNDELGRVYDFSNADGEGWAGVSASASVAIPLKFKSDLFSHTAIGITARYVVGLAYIETISAEGTLNNVSFENPYFTFDGAVDARSSSGGNGYGMDLGMVAQMGDKWTYSFVLTNIIGSVNWNKETENIHFSVEGQRIAVGRSGWDQAITDEDSSFAIDAFSTRLPSVMDLSAAFRLNSNWLFTTGYEQGLNKSLGGTTSPRVAFGSEFTALSFLPIRAGLSFGGRHGLGIGAGFGLNLNFWYLDLGFMNYGGLTPNSSKGLSLAATTRLRF